MKTALDLKQLDAKGLAGHVQDDLNISGKYWGGGGGCSQVGNTTHVGHSALIFKQPPLLIIYPALHSIHPFLFLRGVTDISCVSPTGGTIAI